MLIILGILGFFVLKIEDIQIDRGGGTRKVTAIFDSVAGLDAKSAVRVAGVRVGKVEKIKLRDDGRAEVTLEIDGDVQLHKNATASVANLGLLGEKYIELNPGSPNLPQLVGENVTLQGSQPATIDEITTQVADIATDVKAITESLRAVVGGPQGQQRLNEIVDNVNNITAQMRLLVAANRGNDDATMSNMAAITADLRREIPKLAASLDRVASQIGGTVGENRDDVRVVVENLRGLSSDLRTTADNLNSITGQVKSGEGSVGKLLYSDEAHNRLTSALSSVESGVTELKNTLGRANRITMDVGIRSDVYAGLSSTNEDGVENAGGNSRSALSLRLVPNPENNRFYNVELSDDPRGSRRDKTIVETVKNPETGEEITTVTETKKYERKFLISAQAGWQLDQLGVRVGLFDSTGGVGADYALNDRIKVTGEAFDFGKKRDDNPHLRVFGEYTVRKEKPNTPRLFVTGGVDNMMNDTAFTFGGGIRWRDDDLKYLIGSIPMGK
jgi:phospholipid/cholesterol/gamma-HCH transport system substrate-binding protein